MAREHPSFTDEVKAELANLQPGRPCCQHAELRAIVHAMGGAAGREQARLRIPRNAVARKVVQLAKATGGSVEAVRKGPTGRRPTYQLDMRLQLSQASSGACCARATIRGLFLARGAIGNPANGYHFEVALPDGLAGTVSASLQRLHLPLGRLARRGRAVYYVKGADTISRVLSLLGANRAVMRFENGRIVREMRSQANRRANSETANLDKRLRTAIEQLRAIRRLQARDAQLRALPPALRTAAQLRLAHPRARLQDLAAQAQLSKSAMAHRMRRLMDWAARAAG